MSIRFLAATNTLEAVVLTHTGFMPFGDKDDITPDQSEASKPQFTGTYIRYVKKPCTVPSAGVVLPAGSPLVGARWQAGCR